MSGRLDQALGTVDGVNQDFATPAPYAPGTLVVFKNGRQLSRDLDNGWTEVDPAAGTFRMKLPPVAPETIDDPGDILFCYYDTGAAVSVGGAQDGGIPLMAGALELRPGVTAAELRPDMLAGADQEAQAGVPLVSAEQVRPKTETAEELRPNLVSAKEV